MFNKSPKGNPVSLNSRAKHWTQTEFGNPESKTRGIFKTNKKVLPALLSGFITVFSFGCGQEDQTLFPDPSNSNTLSTFSRNTHMTLANYNVQNFFGDTTEPGKETQKPKPEEAVAALAESIKLINADVIALEEVQSVTTLRTFLNKYLPDQGYGITLIQGNDQRGINVAVLSRFPVTNVITHKDAPLDMTPVGNLTNTFSRDLLQVKIKVSENYTFSLFVTHLISKIGGQETDIKRKAEASKIRDILTTFSEQNPNANYALMGDFNDTYDTDTLSPILSSNRSRYDTVNNTKKRNLLNLNDLILQDLGNSADVYTFHPIKYRSRIDYILLSSGMYNEYIPKSVKIFKSEETGEGVTNPFLITASDHYPVTAGFNLSTDR